MSAQHVPRLPDWPERLAAMCDQARSRPMAWGTHDCCTWAADVVHAITGRDPLADLRGSWSTAAEALRVLDQLGGLQQAVLQRLGAPLRSLVLAQRGDVVLVITRGRQALAVCLGATVAGPGPEGLVQHPMLPADAEAPVQPLLAWRA